MSTNSLDHLLEFLRASPTPFHACQQLALKFKAGAYQLLNEKDEWQLKEGGRYFYTRSDSSFVAFKVGRQGLQAGLRLLGTHTDSPCLKLKPEPELTDRGFLRLGIEVYGGVLLNPWFDRDLSLAGKVSGLNKKGQLCSALINFDSAIATIPSLAIHLDRNINSNKTVNPQVEMNALLLQGETSSLRSILLEQVLREHPDLDMAEVLDFNLSFYDVQPPAVIGLNKDFIASARLDNLLSTFIAAEALLQDDSDYSCVLICNDHEEVGSRSEVGAQGTLLKDLLQRWVKDSDEYQRTLRKSLLISIDNAHALHPNYPDKHDGKHGPALNAGPVLKFNASQSYATGSDGAAFIRMLAAAEAQDKIPLQSFVMRADMMCGSTIGPLTASNVGIKTVDIGVPQFAMHSIRELSGVRDMGYMLNLLSRFLCSDSVELS